MSTNVIALVHLLYYMYTKIIALVYLLYYYTQKAVLWYIYCTSLLQSILAFIHHITGVGVIYLPVGYANAHTPMCIHR